MNVRDLLNEPKVSVMSLDPDIEPLFAINGDLRTITVPESMKTIGVESDHNVERIWFKCPRFFDGNDLSEFDVFVNYVNASGNGDVYHVDDLESEENALKFSWLISRNVTESKGVVRFIVCMKKFDESEVIQEYNTTIAEVIVLEGLETFEGTINKSPDAWKEILDRLDSLESMGGGSGGIKPGDALTIDEEKRLCVVTAKKVEEGNTFPVTSGAVYTEIGNVESLLTTI